MVAYQTFALAKHANLSVVILSRSNILNPNTDDDDDGGMVAVIMIIVMKVMVIISFPD